MAIVAGCLILCIWLVGIPLLTGAVPAFFLKHGKTSPAFMWTSGYMISWALFQFVTVPLVLLHVERGFAVAVGLFAGVSLTVAAVVCVTLVAAILVANIVGSSLPILAKRLGLDPTVTASPLITTIVDAVVLMIYFNIAKAVLGI